MALPGLGPKWGRSYWRVPNALATTMASNFYTDFLFQVSQVGVILPLEIEVVAIQRSCRLLVLTPASRPGFQVEVTLLEAHRLPVGLVSSVGG